MQLYKSSVHTTIIWATTAILLYSTVTTATNPNTTSTSDPSRPSRPPPPLFPEQTESGYGPTVSPQDAMLLIHEQAMLSDESDELHFVTFIPYRGLNTDRSAYRQYTLENPAFEFIFRKVFNQEYVLGRVLVRGPLAADHVRCAFLGEPSDGQSGEEKGEGDGEAADKVGLVEKLHFDWNMLVVADEPYSGVICRAYLRLGTY